MASAADAQSLFDKLRDLPSDKLAEVEDFVDFLRQKQQRAKAIPNDQLRAAVDAGHIIAPVRGRERSSVSQVPPAIIPGTPPSEIVLRDRR